MKEVPLKDHKDLAKKAELFNRELAEGTLVYAHIKGPDEFGHDGDATGKKKNIETIDEIFFGAIANRGTDARLAVSCDHATPCAMKMHSSDPVPLMITTSESDRDCCRFTEGDAKKGSLGVMKGADVLAKTFAMA